jgi:hypothetical protein
MDSYISRCLVTLTLEFGIGGQTHVSGIRLVIESTALTTRSVMSSNLRNNSWKPYVYIVFTTGRPLCHEVLP